MVAVPWYKATTVASFPDYVVLPSVTRYERHYHFTVSRLRVPQPLLNYEVVIHLLTPGTRDGNT